MGAKGSHRFESAFGPEPSSIVAVHGAASKRRNMHSLEWADWFNNRRLLEPVGTIPPAEAETNCYAALENEAMAA